MLDHVIVEVVSAIKDALENSMLEFAELDEKFQFDIWQGDIRYKSSCTLPGEANPPKIRTDILLDWTTWSQSAYRSWWMGDGLSQLPTVGVEVRLRIQLLARQPDVDPLLPHLPEKVSLGKNFGLARADIRIESLQKHDRDSAIFAVEIVYLGSMRLIEKLLESPAELKEHIGAIGPWLASTMITLSDQPLDFVQG